jgi:hypothetical protein
MDCNSSICLCCCCRAVAARVSILELVKVGSSSTRLLVCVLYRVVSHRNAALCASSQVVTSGNIWFKTIRVFIGFRTPRRRILTSKSFLIDKL